MSCLFSGLFSFPSLSTGLSKRLPQFEPGSPRSFFLLNGTGFFFLLLNALAVGVMTAGVSSVGALPYNIKCLETLVVVNWL